MIKNNKIVKTGTGIIIAVILISAYVFKYISINSTYPETMYQTYTINQPVNIEQVQVKLIDSKMMDDDNLRKLGSVYEKDIYFGEEMKSIVPKIQIINKGDTEKKVDIYSFMAESGAWSNSVNMPLFLSLNGENATLNPNLKPNESITVNLPFTMNVSQFGKENWKTVKERDYQLVLSLYPAKKAIKL